MESFQWHPAFNAALNLTSLIFLVLGRRAIVAGRRDLHRRRMLLAFTASGVFLVSYVVRYLTTGAHKYPGDGADKVLYLLILTSHMLLAMVLLPAAIRALHLALTSRFVAHKRLVRWVWPLWIYVSTTGVLVYLMLYHLAPALS
jgi:putative membrane protein